MSADKTSYLAQMRGEAFSRKPPRFGRGGMPKNRLLDDADNNLGNIVASNPQLEPSIKVQTNPARILQLDALSPTAQMVTVTLGAQFNSRPNPPFNAFPFLGTFGGPIVAIIEFGNGSVFQRVEIDVPIGPAGFLTNSDEIPPPYSTQLSGTSISVPAGTLRVYARNDANLIPSDVEGNIIGAPADPSEEISTGPASALVQAHVSYFTRGIHTKAPTRTVYVYRGVGFALDGGTFPAGYMPIPPFAKSFRIYREEVAASVPDTIPISINFRSGIQAQMLTNITIPAGPSPTIEVPGLATFFGISSTPAEVDFCAIEFQIGL